MPYLPDRPVDEAASLRALTAGGLPLRAQRRLAELSAGGQRVFTSTLSPAESVVAKSTGLTPLSQVMGASIVHVGWSGTGGLSAAFAVQGFELTALTEAHQLARSRALTRLQEEARLLGAHVVVGVDYQERRVSWADDLIEVLVTGTAMRVAGFPETQTPPLTLLSADELWKLHHAGYWPVAIAMGNCYWYEPHCDCRADGSYFSAPLRRHNYATAQARHLATTRFREFAAYFKADGVLGVKVRRHAHSHEDDGHTRFRVEILLVGTAVQRRGDAAKPDKPMIILDLNALPGRKERLQASRRNL